MSYDARRIEAFKEQRGEGFHGNQSQESLTPQKRRPPLDKLSQTKPQTIER